MITNSRLVRFAVVLSAALVVVAPSTAGAGHRRPLKIIDEAHCVTDPVPAADVPSDVEEHFARGSPVFGENALWSVAPDRGWFDYYGDPRGDAVAGLKLGWYRREPGTVEITVEMLPSEIEQVEANSTWDPPDGTSWVPDGYGATGFQVSGIDFPDYGCWMISGELRSAEHGGRLVSAMSFLIWVPVPAKSLG